MDKKKAIIAHGLVAGLIMNLSWWVYNWIFVEEGTYDDSIGEIIGYATMVLGLGEIFMGVRKYRNKFASSFPFKDAFLLGLGMVLVASLVYTVGWMLYSSLMIPDFMEIYSHNQVTALEESGASLQEVEELRVNIAQLTEWYSNPFFKFGMTFMEFFPIGLIFSAVIALVLKRK